MCRGPDKLAVALIDDGDSSNGDGPIAPSPQTVADGTYQPLARPIFIYVAKSAAVRPEVDLFVEYYLSKGAPLVQETGYIPLPPKAYQLALERWKDGVTGSPFEAAASGDTVQQVISTLRDQGGGSKVGVTVEDLLAGK